MSTKKSQISAALKLVKERIKDEKSDEKKEEKEFDIVKAAKLMAKGRE